MSKQPRVLLEHMQDCMRLIQLYTQQVTKEEFLSSPQIQDAVIRRIEIIGEAAKNLPLDWRNQHPEIPWRQIAGMRDLLVHAYFNVDLEQTWTTVQRDMPDLSVKLSAILSQLE